MRSWTLPSLHPGRGRGTCSISSPGSPGVPSLLPPSGHELVAGLLHNTADWLVGCYGSASGWLFLLLACVFRGTLGLSHP